MYSTFVDGMRVCVVGSVDIVDLSLVLAHTVCVLSFTCESFLAVSILTAHAFRPLTSSV